MDYPYTVGIDNIMYYTDGGVFGGHSVEVSGNSKGPTKAQITG